MRKVKFFARSIAIAIIASIFTPTIPNANATPTFYAFDNGRIRIGTGLENSVNDNGMFQQPFYKSGSTYYKLTFSDYPLDIAVALGGDGTSNWNLNGTIITTNNASYADTFSSARATPSVSDTDYSGFVALGNSGSGVYGYGTIVSNRNLTISGETIKVTNTYTLGQNDSYIQIKTKITNTKVSGSISNLRTWVGTRDDWVGNSDSNIKERGDISTGSFILSANQAERSPALRIKSGSEGVLFYSTSEKAYASINFCCYFSNAYQQNPATSVITTNTPTDGSYAMYVRMSDLAAGASEEFTWFYAAGALADLNAVTSAVAAAAAPAVPTGEPGNAQVALTWTQPTSADPIVGYRIYQSTDGSNFDSGTDQISTGLTKTITGLTNGTSYYFKVAALTGTSPYTAGTPSGASAAIIPRTVPDAPTSVTPTRQNSQVLLSWTAPVSNGGSAITDYKIEYSSDSGSNWTEFVRSASTSTSATVTGLSNGTGYVFRVTAKNVAGFGAASSTSSSATPVPPFAVTLSVDQTSITAGQTVTATVTSYISDGVVYSDYGGSAPTITVSSDSQAVNATPSSWSSGVSTVVVTLKTAGSHSLSTTISGLTATAGPVTVGVGALNKFGISLPGSLTENQVATATITAQDAFGNTVTTYTPSAPTLSSAGNQAQFGTLSSWVNGVATVTVSYPTAGSRNFVYTDGAISRTVSVTIGVPTNPVVTGVSPSTSTTDGGVTATITGSQLTGTTGVTIGGVAATNVVVVSDSEITFTVPAGIEGSATIVVTTSAGSDTNALQFTFTPNAATIAARERAAAAAEARAEAARREAANRELSSRISVEPIQVSSTSGTQRFTVTGSSTFSAQVAPESKASFPNVSEVKVAGNQFEVVTIPTYSGKMTVPVTINENGAVTTVTVEIVVNPKPVESAKTIPVSAKKSNIEWSKSPNAISYVVTRNGKEICSTTGSSCQIPKIIGPKSEITVISLGNDGTISEEKLPAFIGDRPIPVKKVSISNASSSLNSKDLNRLKEVINLVKEEGFNRVSISVPGQSGIPTNTRSNLNQKSKNVAQYLLKEVEIELDPVEPNEMKANSKKSTQRTLDGVRISVIYRP